jgi:hypothetical protein
MGWIVVIRLDLFTRELVQIVIAGLLSRRAAKKAKKYDKDRYNQYVFHQILLLFTIRPFSIRFSPAGPEADRSLLGRDQPQSSRFHLDFEDCPDNIGIDQRGERPKLTVLELPPNFLGIVSIFLTIINPQGVSGRKILTC